jgi:hypothetical protein
MDSAFATAGMYSGELGTILKSRSRFLKRKLVAFPARRCVVVFSLPEEILILCLQAVRQEIKVRYFPSIYYLCIKIYDIDLVKLEAYPYST